ncbi:MAG: hypothetical protein ACKOWC_04425, partial [Limnohabitans sp.]
RFAPLAERQKLDAMAAKTTLEPGLMEKLKREEPVLRIQVFADRLEVSEAAVTQAPKAQAPKVQAPKEAASTPEKTAVATSEKLPASAPASAPAAEPPVAAAPRASLPQTATDTSLLGHEKTAQALEILQKDTARQKVLLKWMGTPQYAECSVMVADIDQKVRSGQHELSAEQWNVYPGVAATVVFMKTQLLARKATEADLERAVKAVRSRQQSRGVQSVYEACYKAMRPIYQQTLTRP